MIRTCPVCRLDVHDRRNSGRLRVHVSEPGKRCEGSDLNLREWSEAEIAEAVGDEQARKGLTT